MIHVTLLGTAALAPLPDRALTAAVLTCEGRGILFDCGEGTQTAARRCGVSLLKIDLIALTHYHGDHIFGLPGLLQTMFCLGRTSPLTITGPEGLEDALAPILTLAGPLPFPLRLVSVPAEGLSLSEIGAFPMGSKLESFPTVHRVPSQAYRFTLPRSGKFDPRKAKELNIPQSMWKQLQRGQPVTVDGREIAPDMVLGAPRRGLTVAFSGDTARCPGLVACAKDADLFISEGTYGEDSQEELAVSRGHMTFTHAGETAAEAGAHRLWLTHFSQTVTDPAACLHFAEAHFPGAVCGTDGMDITLTFPD